MALGNWKLCFVQRSRQNWAALDRRGSASVQHWFGAVERTVVQVWHAGRDCGQKQMGFLLSRCLFGPRQSCFRGRVRREAVRGCTAGSKPVCTPEKWATAVQ